jgi:hypothetical protein
LRITGEQRDGRSRQNPAAKDVGAGLGEPARQRFLETDSRRSRIAAKQDFARAPPAESPS